MSKDSAIYPFIQKIISSQLLDQNQNNKSVFLDQEPFQRECFNDADIIGEYGRAGRFLSLDRVRKAENLYNQYLKCLN